METGPNTIPASATALLSLIDNLGLKLEIANSCAKNRYIFYHGKFHPVPMGPLAFFTSGLLSWRGKCRLLSEPFQPVPTPYPKEQTVQAFAQRRLGPEVTERLLAPFLSGIYAGDPSKLDAISIFPKLVTWEKETGSLFKGACQALQARGKNRSKPRTLSRHTLVNVAGGLCRLPQALAQSLGAHYIGSCPALQLSRGNGHWLVSTPDGTYAARQLVLCIPALKAATLLEPSAPELSARLKTITYAPISVIQLALPTSFALPRGFGFLVPASEKLSLLGCIFTSQLFPDRAPRDQHLLTCFIGGALSPQLATQEDSELLPMLQRDFKTLFDLEDTIPLSLIHRKIWHAAIPQYTLGHSERLQEMKALPLQEKALYLGSNWQHGVSLNAVVEQAKALAAEIIRG
jgi:oxygen-dependent protoporphyrinogen oxidase